jgi:3-oxoadipate enol-lactonase / 4-carboxymuconolactone decarboxylase
MVLDELDSVLRRQAVAVDVTVRARQSLADVAHDVLHRHPGSHVLVGHSFGGMLAQEMTLIDPARVRGLVLISTIPGATQRVTGINRALADNIEANGLENVVDDFAAGLFAPGTPSRRPHLGRPFVTDMLDAGPTSVCAALRAIADWDATDRLSAVECPATMIAGETEPDLPRQSLLARLIGARFEVLSDTGHLAPLEAPADVARIIVEMAIDMRRLGRISGDL